MLLCLGNIALWPSCMHFSSKNRLLSFALIYFILYLVGALIFYKERIFLDGTYYFFHVVQAENFWVEHQRFILIPSQLLLWIGVKLHLSLPILLVLNSVTPVLYLFILFLLSVMVFKDNAAGWALLMIGVCGVYFLYFCPMYEVWYGAALLILFSSLIYKQFYNTPFQLVLVALVTVTLLFSYPLMVFGFFFILLYHFLEIRRIPLRLMIVLSAVFLFWIAWKIFFISDYESGKIGYPWSRIAATAKENLGSIANLKALLLFLIRTYTEELLAFFIVLAVLVCRRKYKHAGLVALSIGGFILMVILTQSTPWYHSNYYERMYLLLVPMCMIPFLREVYQTTSRKLIFEFVFLGIISLRGVQIVLHSKYYSARIAQVSFFIDQANKIDGSKFYLDEQKYAGNSALNEWSFPMETLIFSSLKKNESVTISLKSDIENIENSRRLTPENFHLRLTEIIEDDKLNQHYFQIHRGTYHRLNTN
jgi:hypothetical protein